MSDDAEAAAAKIAGSRTLQMVGTAFFIVLLPSGRGLTAPSLKYIIIKDTLKVLNLYCGFLKI
jgi:hypothetical protein